MTKKRLSTSTWLLATGLALGLLWAGTAGAASPATEAAGDRDDLVGTWTLRITPDDGSPSFVGFYTFFADGNASFSSAGPPLPALGNPGYGVWRKVSPKHYEVTILQNTYSPDLQFDGTLKILADLRLKGRHGFVTEDTVVIYDPAGHEIVTLGGSAHGSRLFVQPRPGSAN